MAHRCSLTRSLYDACKGEIGLFCSWVYKEIGGIILVIREDILIGKSIISSRMFNKIYEELLSGERKNVDDIWNNMLCKKIEKIKASPIFIVAEP